MTNAEIIFKSATMAGIYSQEELVMYMKATGELPLHTYKEWQNRGYQVKKGEKSVLTCDIWKPKKTKAKEEAEKAEEEKKDNGFFLAKAFFFKPEQVEKIVLA